MVVGIKTRATVAFVEGGRKGQMMATVTDIHGLYIETRFYDSCTELVHELNYLLGLLNYDVPDLPSLDELEKGADLGNRKMHCSRERTLDMIRAEEQARSSERGHRPGELMVTPRERNRQGKAEAGRRFDEALKHQLSRGDR